MNTKIPINKKYIFLSIVVALEIIVLALAGMRFLRSRGVSETLSTSLDEANSYYAQRVDNGWYVNAETAVSDQDPDWIFVPEYPLKAGSYAILIDYECDEDQTLDLIAQNGLKRPLYNDQYAKLYHSMNQVVCRTRVFADCDLFQVVVHFNQLGGLRINNISIMRDSLAAKQDFLLVLSIVLIIDILYLLRRKIWAHRLTVFPLAGIILLMSLPLFADGLDRILMHDINFHLLRIEGIAKELRSGHFPVKLESLWLEGYGYANAIFYGDILLYFPAMLRLISIPIDIAYKCYILFVNALTCLIAYYCFHEIFRERNIAQLLTLVYGLSSYRLVNVYVRAAAGECSAMAFIPLVLLVIYKIYSDTETACRHYKKYALLLAIGMTGLLETHLLSTEMIVFTMALVCILFLRKTFRKDVLKLYCLAVVETILLNLYFLVPFLDYYINVPVKITQKVQGTAPQLIQSKGAHISQYFEFWRDLFTEPRFLLTPGLALIFAGILGCLYSLRRGTDVKIRFFTLFSAAALFVASDRFPWDFLVSHSKLMQMLSQIQFPWRFLGIACLCLTMLIGLILAHQHVHNPKHSSFLYIATIAMCLITILHFTYAYCRGISNNHYYETSDLYTEDVGFGEYILTSAKKTARTGQIICGGLQEIDILARDGCHYELQIKCLPDENGYINLPLFNYKGYIARDNAGNKYEIDPSSDTVAFRLPPAFEGHITVDFAEPWYWRLAELISLITVICLIFFSLSSHRKTA